MFIRRREIETIHRELEFLTDTVHELTIRLDPSKKSAEDDDKEQRRIAEGIANILNYDTVGRKST